MLYQDQGWVTEKCQTKCIVTVVYTVSDCRLALFLEFHVLP